MKAHVNFMTRHIESRKEIPVCYDNLSHPLELIIQEINPKVSHYRTSSLFKPVSALSDINMYET